MTEHITNIEHLSNQRTGDRHRWVCSCGADPGEWKPREFQARQGASKHVYRCQVAEKERVAAAEFIRQVSQR